MRALKRKPWTLEEYLAFERANEQKHEFFNGDIYLMADACERHNLIVVNTSTILNVQLRQQPCKVYANDLRVRIRLGDYFYPDVVVVCGDAKLEDSEVDTLLNPTLIIEVLSNSTEQFDRGDKFKSYRTLSSLQEYVLISQDEPRIERFARQANGDWLFSETAAVDATVQLPSIGCTLALDDVYAKVLFDKT